MRTTILGSWVPPPPAAAAQAWSEGIRSRKGEPAARAGEKGREGAVTKDAPRAAVALLCDGLCFCWRMGVDATSTRLFG